MKMPQSGRTCHEQHQEIADLLDMLQAEGLGWAHVLQWDMDDDRWVS